MTWIRQQKPGDENEIFELIKEVFGRTTEADLLHRLQKRYPDPVSLVATIYGRIVGQILFSPVTIESKSGPVRGMGLGPISVLKSLQRMGIGSELIRRGIEILREQNCPFIMVQGHNRFYSRFGFEPAAVYGLAGQGKVPKEAFMILILDME